MKSTKCQKQGKWEMPEHWLNTNSKINWCCNSVINHCWFSGWKKKLHENIQLWFLVSSHLLLLHHDPFFALACGLLFVSCLMCFPKQLTFQNEIRQIALEYLSQTLKGESNEFPYAFLKIETLRSTFAHFGWFLTNIGCVHNQICLH